MTGGPPRSAEPVPGRASFLSKFTVLKGGIRELWLVFAVKFVGIAAYAATNSTLVLWLSSDFGYSDQAALGLVAAWSASMTVATLLVGSLTDALGLRKTFFLGAWMCIAARAVMVFANVKWLALAGGLFPLAVGEALGTPVLVASIRRYSTTSQRSISFSIFYVMMNFGFLAAGYVFDWVRSPKIGLGEHGHLNLFGMEISSYRTLFLVSLILEIMMLPLLYFIREGAEATDSGLQLAPRKVSARAEGLLQSAVQTVRKSVRDTINLFGGLVRQTGFYRLLGFLVLIAFLKLIFKQMDYVYPKFGIRELGDGAPLGQLWNLNSIAIIVLVPFVGALTQRFSAYRMVVLGGAISAASVFVMALPLAWFQPLAKGWFGHLIAHMYLGLQGSVHPYYVMIPLFVLVLSIGEAFYSPRVYEYAASIAPKGQEASYGALSYVPFLLAKLMVGTVSGMLLAKYCPENGPRHSGSMWLIIALTATIAPLGLIVFRRFIRVQEAGRY
jgi:MFS family permease